MSSPSRFVCDVGSANELTVVGGEHRVDFRANALIEVVIGDQGHDLVSLVAPREDVGWERDACEKEKSRERHFHVHEQYIRNVSYRNALLCQDP